MILALVAIATQIQFDWFGSSLATFLRTDPTAEGLNWVTVRDDLANRGLLPPGTVVAALNWRDAGKIGYALGPATKILCLNRDSRQFGFADPPGAFIGQDMLVLSVGPSEQTTRRFRSAQGLPSTSVRLDGRVLRTVSVLRGQKLLPPP